MASLKRAANGYDYYQNPAIPEDEWSILPKREPRRRQAEQVEVIEKMHPVSQAKRRRAISTCVVILIGFVMLVAVVAQYAAIAETNLDNLNMEAEIQDLETQVEQKLIELEAMGDLKSVQQVAEDELHMGFPDISQVRYIELKEVATPQAEETPQETGFFQNLWDKIVGLFG